MKKMSQAIFTFIFILSLSSLAFSDVTSSITSLIGTNAEGYLAPIGTMLGTDMNTGYFRKASPHKIFGFDITIDFAYAMAPSGLTTYQFVIPDESLDYSFQFQFPKSYLQTLGDNTLLSNIPDANTENNPQYNDDGLFQDIPISFDLPLDKLMEAPAGPAQNILGNSNTADLAFDFTVAGEQIFDQVVNGTWAVAKNIDGIGKSYDIIDKNTELIIATISPAFDSTSFRTNFAEDEDINGAIESSLQAMNLSVDIPGGFGDSFKTLPISIGLPMPILQVSVGLPFHTELTVRGLPVAMPMGSLGTIKFGGFGGKIGISEYLGNILYKTENERLAFEIEDMQYVIDNQSSDINPQDVDKAISYLRLQDMDVQEIDSLNFLFAQGDSTAIVEIKNKMRDTQLQLESMPKKKIKKKKFPIDLSLGYYTNDFILDLKSTSSALNTTAAAADGSAKINSTNRMISLQASKTLNLPSYLSFLGGVGIYGGFGIEWSTLDLEYILANPLAFGCFTDATNTSHLSEITDESVCTASYSDGWHSGVPTPIALSFPGDNKFRSIIGARMRILLMDAFIDYNFGASRAINVGLGLTIR